MQVLLRNASQRACIGSISIIHQYYLTMAQLSKIYFFNDEIDIKEYLNNEESHYNEESHSIDKESPLKDYRLHLSKRCNELEPTSIAFCESIEIDMDAPEPTDISLQNWFLKQEIRDLIISTDIEIAKAVASDSKHQIICKGAQCYSFEDYVADENSLIAKRRIHLFFEANTVTVVHNKSVVATYKHL